MICLVSFSTKLNKGAVNDDLYHILSFWPDAACILRHQPRVYGSILETFKCSHYDTGEFLLTLFFFSVMETKFVYFLDLS